MMRLLGCVIGLWLVAHAAASQAIEPARTAPVEVKLTADLDGIPLRQVELIRVLIEAAGVIDTLYQAQLAGDGLYPDDMSRAEFEAWRDPRGRSPYTLVRRNETGALVAIPYHEAWPVELGRLARLLARAAELTNDEALRNYLTQRARALIVGHYPRAEQAWQALRHSDVDVLIGPIGVDDDTEFGLKAAFGAYVLLRDWAWGAKLARFSVFLPEFQNSLPVSPLFRAEVPEVETKVAVYDLIYHAGYGAARSGTVTPEAAGDRRVRLEQGPRRLQLRNVMRARFDALVQPVTELLIDPDQRGYVSFEAFFLNTMLHEMAHELGLRETVTGSGPVSEALGEYAGVIEETKAAVLSLWMAEQLHARGELPTTTRMAHYTSFLAGSFRAIQLDAAGDAGRARQLVLNYFRDWNAFRRDPETGYYSVNPSIIPSAIETLTAQVLSLQGIGDRNGAAQLVATFAVPRDELRADLARLDEAGVPAAIVFLQGKEFLGL
jgi:hypothetical protein